ncbi:MAG TPA: alpha/beta hydrolase, partial [Candidatus Sulfotelmatobacter sp.]|nr:alpha/beta hydrolase [Candidatus Sulfotelmatobacter sp.]
MPSEAAATSRTTAYLQTSDGRTLAYEQQGDPGGVPVFALHGTPGSRLSGLHPDPEKVRKWGLRLITYDRPGYGGSTRRHGRSVGDCVADIVTLAEELGLERFAVTGSSGGGPHALAAAARLPERVTRAECNVGPAPYEAEGLDYFNGMDPENAKEVGWALAGEETLVPELEREAQKALDRLDVDPAALLSEFNLSEADRAVLAQEVMKQRMRISFIEAMTQGIAGWVDDDLAFVRPWGFEVAEIRVPVQVRYGAGDVLVPPGHGAWLAAHIPGATVLVDEVSGHISTPDERLDRIRA